MTPTPPTKYPKSKNKHHPPKGHPNIKKPNKTTKGHTQTHKGEQQTMPPADTITQDNPAPHTPPTTSGSHSPKSSFGSSFSKLSFPSKFSRKHLAIFAVLFAGLGSYFIFQSFAATPPIVTKEAETLTMPASGASIISDSNASGGQAVKFTQKVSATGSVDLPNQVTSLTVRAKETACRGDASFTLTIDNAPVATKTVTSGSWSDYTTTGLNLPAGSHSLSLSYDNPYSWKKCTRALFIDKIDFFGPDTTAIGGTTVTLKPLVEGSVIAGGIPVEATVTGNNGVSKVEFYIDTSTTPAKIEANAPYCLAGDITSTCSNWDSTTVPNGPHSIAAYAYDSAGNKSAPSTINFTVENNVVVPVGSGPAYYVSPIGSDANNGTSASSPWKTIGYAASVVTTEGSTINVMAGTYAEDVILGKSGTANGAITLKNNGTDKASIHSLAINAKYVTATGLDISGSTGPCVTIQPGLSNITIQNNQITNCGRDGVRMYNPGSQAYTNNVIIKNNTFSGAGKEAGSDANNLTIFGDNVTIENNTLGTTPNDAINAWGDRIIIRKNKLPSLSNAAGRHNDFFQTWTSTGGWEGKPVTNLLIEQNIVQNVTGSDAHCLYSEGAGHHDWTIRNNVFQNIGDQCLIFGKANTEGIKNVNIYNNTFISAGGNNTIEYNLTTTSKLASNIFYNCVGWGGGVPYFIGSSASVTRGYNLAGGTTRTLSETGAVNANPLFVNSASDFHLQSTSPAINKGDNGAIISPPRSTDFDNKATSGVVDIGAYEF